MLNSLGRNVPEGRWMMDRAGGVMVKPGGEYGSITKISLTLRSMGDSIVSMVLGCGGPLTVILLQS